jgi:hypothetical protein
MMFPYHTVTSIDLVQDVHFGCFVGKGNKSYYFDASLFWLSTAVVNRLDWSAFNFIFNFVAVIFVIVVTDVDDCYFLMTAIS